MKIDFGNTTINFGKTKIDFLNLQVDFLIFVAFGIPYGSGRPSKVTREVKELVEQQMRLDDETTPYQLHQLLTNAGYSISLRTILRCRTSLGWTFRGSAYCQVI